MIGPWEIPQQLPVSQFYGLFAGEQSVALSRDDSIEVLNRARERQGKAPLTEGLPDCCLLPEPGWTPPKEG